MFLAEDHRIPKMHSYRHCMMSNAGSLGVYRCVKGPFTVLLVSEHVHGFFFLLKKILT